VKFYGVLFFNFFTAAHTVSPLTSGICPA